MNLIFFDHPQFRQQLLPITYTRPLADIRVGITKIVEKWLYYLKADYSFLTEEYLTSKFPLSLTPDNIYINGSLCPDPELIYKMKDLLPSEGLFFGNVPLIIRGDESFANQLLQREPLELKNVQDMDNPILIDFPWKIFMENANQLKSDFEFLTKNRKSAAINDPYTKVYGKDNIFLEEGVSIKSAILDAENGPIYLGKNSDVGHGAMIRGALALLDHSAIAMGAKMRGDSTIGPYSKVGGEVANSVVLGYSNKGHDGYMGNSIVGEWCNIGADTNSSNMKNDYTEVRLWDYHTGRFKSTGHMFCGFVMGDHTKLGINMMINSGTSLGVACNLYNSNYLRNFIPSFTTGEVGKLESIPVKKVCQTAEKVMERRNVQFTSEDREILEKVFELSAPYRK